MSRDQRQITRYQPPATRDNNPALWPTNWDVGPHPALPDVGWEWIEPSLLPYYRRTAKGDKKVLEEYKRLAPVHGPSGRMLPLMLPDTDDLLHRHGLPISADLNTTEGRALALHYHALRVAKAKLDEEKRAAREAANDLGRHTCHACGVLDRASVRERTVGGWGPQRHRVLLGQPRQPGRSRDAMQGPHLCDDCARTVDMVMRERQQAREAETAQHFLADGQSRRDAVEAFLSGSEARIVGS